MPVPAPLVPQPLAQSTNANALAVHRCRFVDYNPAAITAIAFPPLALPNPHNSRPQRTRKNIFGTLAVGRANGNIEVYEWAVPPHEQERTPKAPQAWVLSKIFYGPNPSKVDSLLFTLRHPHLVAYNEVPAFADLRLFSAGGGSELVEWDVTSGTVLRTLNSQGGAIWSMAANPGNTQLALGCEDGRVRLLDIFGDELAHLRRFDRVKCRILSIAWGPPVPPATSDKKGVKGSETSDEEEDDEWTDTWLVTGGSDSNLRKWDAKTGRVLDRMSTDKARGERTLVWSVGVLADGTIISGDSLGIVKFWDSRTCTQLYSFSAHGADVLCMAIGPDGNSVFTSGVDQKVCLFTHVKFSNPDKTAKKAVLRASSRWVQSTSKRRHSHDVRALAVWPPYLPISPSIRSSNVANPSPFSGIAPILVSGGLDASLVLAPCASAGTASQHMVNPLATSTVSTFEDAYHRRLAYPTGLSPAVSVARNGRLIVCVRDTGVSVWRIIGRARAASALEADLRTAQAMDVDTPTPKPGGTKERGGEDEERGYEKLLDMDLDTMTNLCSSAVSDDGRWLAVSDAHEVKLFELLADADDSTLQPRRVKSFMPMLSAYLSPNLTSGREPEGASALGFTPDGGRLVLALARTARVLVVDLSGHSPEGRPEPCVLRNFEHHARRGALFARGRVVRGMPGRAGGTLGTDVDADAGASDGAEGAENADKSGDVEMDDEDGAEMKDGDSEDESKDEDEEEYVLVTRMAFSPDGQWFATTDDHCRTHIFNLDAVQHHTLLPTSPALVSALAFSPPAPTLFSSTPSASASSGATLLVLAHADATIGVFDVDARRFAPWAAHLAQHPRLPQRWTSLHDGVLGIAVEPPPCTLHSSFSVPSSYTSAHPPSSSNPATAVEGGRHVLFWGATWLCRVALDAPVGWGGFLKKRRRDNPSSAPPAPAPSQASRSKPKSNAKSKTHPASASSVPAPDVPAENADAEAGENLSGENDSETLSNFKLVSRYRPILRVDFLNAGELLVVERPLVDFLRGLPPAFFKPRYGS